MDAADDDDVEMVEGVVAMFSSDLAFKLRCKIMFVVEDCGRMNFGFGRAGGGGLAVFTLFDSDSSCFFFFRVPITSLGLRL